MKDMHRCQFTGVVDGGMPTAVLALYREVRKRDQNPSITR